ncbi:MAG: aminotransferase class I/II-fold pyridoxal phosphate-dependent enzyme [Fibrobacterota bacterium]
MNIIKAAQRTVSIQYPIRDVVLYARKAAEKHEKMFWLNIGDPMKYDFRVPEPMREAVIKAVIDGKGEGYEDSYGNMEARESVSGYFLGQKGVEISPDDILLTMGASEGITMALTSIINPGENVLTPCPGYPQYQSVIGSLGGELNEYRLDEKNGWEPDIEDIERRINKKTKALAVINPNNPTGSVCSRETLLKIIELARKNNLIILSDEIYDRMVFGKQHISPVELCDDVPIIVFNGLAKCFLAPGWRTGWCMFRDKGLVMQEIKAAVQALARMRLCINSPFQHAVKPALEGESCHIGETITKLDKRRRLVTEKLNSIPGCSAVMPEAAFYIFPKIELENGMSDEEFCRGLIDEEGVVTVYGDGFGKCGGNHFRVVYLADEADLEEAMKRIRRYVEKVRLQ